MMRQTQPKRFFLPLMLTILGIGLLMAGSAFLYEKNSASTERADRKDYFQSDQGTAVIIDDQLQEIHIRTVEGQDYLPFSLVRKRINAGFYYEQDQNAVLLSLPAGELNLPVDGENSGVRMIDGELYLSTEVVRENSDIEMEKFSDPDRVMIRTTWSSLQGMKLTKEAPLRTMPGKKSPILKDLTEGEVVLYRAEEGRYLQVSTKDGFTGYVQKDHLVEMEEAPLPHTTDSRFLFPQEKHEGKICLGFQYMNAGSNGTEALDELIQDTEGMNVIVPSCFIFGDQQGQVTSYLTAEYVAHAKERGLSIWGMLNDIEGEGGELGELLSKKDVRNRIIEQLTSNAVSLGIEGINVDLETVSEESVPQYLQFLKELCQKGHEAGLIISADAYVPMYTQYLNRKEQAKTLDYLVMMGYDAYTDGSEEIGPNAALPFVEQGIKDTLREVKGEKLIVALPFYSRGWVSTGTGFSSESYGMEQAVDFAERHGITSTWDEETGQLYGESEDADGKYTIWIEDEKSIEAKLGMMRNYELAGVAFWRIGLERKEVWPIIQKYLESS